MAVSGSDASYISYYSGDLLANLKLAYQRSVYYSAGTYTSGAIDIGFNVPSWGNLSWTNSGGQTITMKVRSDADGDFSNATDWGSCSSISSGNALSTGSCVTDGHRYIQYQASLSTSDIDTTPSLDDVTIGYNIYPNSATLTSSKYDSGSAANVISSLSWTEDSSLPSGTTATVSLRTAGSEVALDDASWTDFTNATANCTNSSGAVSCAAAAIPAAMKNGSDDQWFQYKVTLTSTGANTPTVSDVTVQYVVNGAPAFDATYGTNGVTVSQQSDGTVLIQYKALDADTESNLVTPSFEYSTNGGSTWTNITSQYLADGDLSDVSVNGVTYTLDSATWSAASQASNVYAANAKIRVSAGDNQLANATTSAASANFTLDTKAPVLTAILNASENATTTVSVTDDLQSRYRLCNDPSFPDTDAQGNSCAWSVIGEDVASTTVSWTPRTDAQGDSPVYLEAEDTVNNATTLTIVAPATPTSFAISDISNTSVNAYKEFLSWSVFTATTSSAFSAYHVYGSTDGSTYTLLSSITDSATNFYTHTITTATSSRRYYRIAAENAQGNTSPYTSVLSDTPDGDGITDTTAPTVSAGSVLVPSATLSNTSAVVTFSADELSIPSVQYRINGESAWTTATGTTYSLAHSVTLQGLTANTTYNVQARATDVVGNIGNLVAGSDFTTDSGPVISNIAASVDDTSATITWQTSTSSDSYVYYSTSSALTNASSRGSAALVSCSGAACAHSVALSSLAENTTYYYYVTSTDGESNVTTANNSGTYYNFTTTADLDAPVVSNIATPVVAPNAAVITWQTDRVSTSQVTWGTQTGVLSRTTTLDATQSIYHVVTLSGSTQDTDGDVQTLTPEGTYFFKVHSTGSNNVSTTSEEQSFVAPRTGDVIVVSTHGGGGGGGSGTPVSDRPTTPPTLTAVTADSPSAFTATVKADADRDVIAIVQFGRDTNYGSTAGDPEYSKSKAVKLDRLLEGTTYHYRITMTDRHGNQASSGDQTFKTQYVSEALDERTLLEKATEVQDRIEQLIESALPSLAPPFITDPIISSTTESTATVSWKTNIRASGSVRYATDEEFAEGNSYVTEVSEGPTATSTREHSVTLTGLSPDTVYHVQASSYVFPQVVGRSKDLIFSTKASPIIPNIAAVRNDGFSIAWKTDQPTTAILEYRDLKTGSSNRIVDVTPRTYHDVKVENLPSGTPYEIAVSGRNASGNLIEAAKTLRVTTSVDVTPPVISNFKVDSALVPGRAGFVQTVVGWQTDKPANSVLYYEEGAGAVGTSTPLANKVEAVDTYTKSHILIIPNLRSGAVYRIKALSTDQSGNTKVFGPTSIITPKQTQSVLDIIVKNFEESFSFLLSN
ncbi:fibronectin type III domain-containing protein [Candidatus Kaiserbacteria bacterium]|nr:fibronectin type III domain-containing protein [Candidatus Kaiserbacteria bacterium]